MRELLFKNLTSQDLHRKNLIMSETVTQGNIAIKTQRRSTYFVKDYTQIEDLSNLNKLKELNERAKSQKRHFYIVKSHNSRTGEDKLFCRVRGFLYVVIGSRVYLIAFINAFRIGVKNGGFNH